MLELRAGSTDLVIGATTVPVDLMMELATEVTLLASLMKLTAGDSTIKVTEVMKMAELMVLVGSTEVKEAITATSLLLVDTQVKTSRVASPVPTTIEILRTIAEFL